MGSLCSLVLLYMASTVGEVASFSCFLQTHRERHKHLVRVKAHLTDMLMHLLPYSLMNANHRLIIPLAISVHVTVIAQSDTNAAFHLHRKRDVGAGNDTS